jgi:hypothetical protein
MKIILLFAILLLAASCHDDDDRICVLNTCLVKDPVTELAWLKAEADGINNLPNDLAKYFFISIAVYKENTVFMVENCCPVCDTMPPILKNCTGEPIGFLSDFPSTLNYMGTIIESVNPNLIDDKQILWRPNNFACNP